MATITSRQKVDRKTTKCQDCPLSSTCEGHNAVPGWGNPEAPLVIVLDDPGHPLAEKLVVWILWRMSLTGNDVYIDYTHKCFVPKGIKRKSLLEYYKICWTSHPRTHILNAKSVVLAGNDSVDFIIGRKMKELHGKKHPESEAWACYDFNYLLMNPAKCVDNWRVIFRAAEEAGLSPKMDTSIDPFRFPSKKLIA